MKSPRHTLRNRLRILLRHRRNHMKHRSHRGRGNHHRRSTRRTDNLRPRTHHHLRLHQSHHAFLQYVVAEQSQTFYLLHHACASKHAARHRQQTSRISNLRLHLTRRHRIAHHLACPAYPPLHPIRHRMPAHRQRHHLAHQVHQIIPPLHMRQLVTQSRSHFLFRVLPKPLRQQQHRRNQSHNHRTRNRARLPQLRQPDAQPLPIALQIRHLPFA